AGWGWVVACAVWSGVGAAEAKPLQIMLLGDALTASEEGRWSYRYYFWRQMVDAELEFDLIGTQRLNDGGPGPWTRYRGRSFDSDHEGHVKWRIDHIVNGRDDGRGNLAGWLERSTPDVVVVLLGTHDALQDKEVEWSVREMRRVIQLFRRDNERVAIVLMTPPPAVHEHAHRLGPLAEALTELALRETTVQSPIRLVDLYSSFDPSTMLAFGGVQPNDLGERFIGSRAASAVLLLDEAHLNPVRKTSAQVWGAVLVVPSGAALGFFLLARSQLRRERAASIYEPHGRGGEAAIPVGETRGKRRPSLGPGKAAAPDDESGQQMTVGRSP
ncbi:MAG: GDSL-type esterase/lipase family protein, partial [Planctomycetota bacterium]